MENNATADGITAKELYPALVQLVIHAESITWNRFYNFLMGNSILVLAWATIFVSNANNTVSRKAVLAAICLLGTASGIAWAALAVRGRRFLFDFVTLGQTLEATQPHWTPALDAVKPLSKAADLRDTQAFRWAGSLYLLVLGSLAFSVLYSVMLVASVGWGWAVVPLGVTAIAVIWFSSVFRTTLRSELPKVKRGDMRAFLRVSGSVFGLIALLHVLRLLLHWPAQIAGWTVPIWVSLVAILAAAALSIWAFRLVRQAGLSSGDAGPRAA